MASKNRASTAGVESKSESGAKPQATKTRDHLIDVGLELMRKNGYGATGLQEILQSAGTPKGSFYHHFTSKEDFTDAVIERYVDLAAEHGGVILGNGRVAPLKRLRRYFEELIKMAGQTAAIQGCLLGKLGLEVTAASTPLQERISLSFRRWQSFIEAVLREAVDKGELPKTVKVEALAGFVLNSWEGALLRSQADKSDAPLHDFVRYVFEELLG